MDFSVRRRTFDGDLGFLELRGELDVETVDAFEACTLALLSEARHVVVDLQHTALVDCRGLSSLLAMRRVACARGGDLRTVGARPVVRLVFDAFGVTALLGGDAPVAEELRRAASRAEVDLRATTRVNAGRS